MTWRHTPMFLSGYATSSYAARIQAIKQILYVIDSHALSANPHRPSVPHMWKLVSYTDSSTHTHTSSNHLSSEHEWENL